MFDKNKCGILLISKNVIRKTWSYLSVLYEIEVLIILEAKYMKSLVVLVQ
ncbi:MAG: hypothetical protein RHS_1203 [Robinsoniella sp. RHS]|nr:MAG: hypothetical protein RHS_1203 [Robinsoniella sp. RHS]